jgi:hypothetical protein
MYLPKKTASTTMPHLAGVYFGMVQHPGKTGATASIIATESA